MANRTSTGSLISRPLIASKIVPGIRAYYRFNETSGTTIYDSSGNGNNGALTNFSGSYFVDNSSSYYYLGGNYLKFTAANSTLTLPQIALGTKFVIGFWWNSVTDGTMTIFEQYVDSNNYIRLSNIYENINWIFVVRSGGVSATVVINRPGGWSHCLFVRDGDAFTVHIGLDGMASTRNETQTVTGIGTGYSSGTLKFTANTDNGIDEFVLWDSLSNEFVSKLVGWYKGDTVGSIPDDSGTIVPALSYSGVTNVPGIINQAWHFDGVDDALAHSRNFNLGNGTVLIDGDKSVSLWFKRDDNTNKGMMYALMSTGPTYGGWVQCGIGWDSSTGAFTVRFSDINTPNVPGRLYAYYPAWNSGVIDLNWHHVVVTFESVAGGYVKIYADGILVTSQQHINGLRTATSLWPGGYIQTRLGHGINAFGFTPYKGAIDQVKEYNKVLTQQDITSLHNEGALSNWYKLDERADTIAYDSGINGESLSIINPNMSNMFVPGIIDNAFYFDGIDDRLIGDYTQLVNGQRFSIGFWFKKGAVDSGSDRIIAGRAGFAYQWYVKWDSYGAFTVYFRPNSATYSGFNYSSLNTEWHHIAFTHDATSGNGTIKIYADKVLVVTQANGSAPIYNTDPQQILLGSSNTNVYLDQAKIYNDYVLVQQDVNFLFKEGAPKPSGSGSPNFFKYHSIEGQAWIDRPPDRGAYEYVPGEGDWQADGELANQSLTLQISAHNSIPGSSLLENQPLQSHSSGLSTKKISGNILSHGCLILSTASAHKDLSVQLVLEPHVIHGSGRTARHAIPELVLPTHIVTSSVRASHVSGDEIGLPVHVIECTGHATHHSSIIFTAPNHEIEGYGFRGTSSRADLYGFKPEIHGVGGHGSPGAGELVSELQFIEGTAGSGVICWGDLLSQPLEIGSSQGYRIHKGTGIILIQMAIIRNLFARDIHVAQGTLEI